MRKGKKHMNDTAAAIEKIINSPTPNPSKEEAQRALRSCGILDKNNKLKSAYRGIIVKAGSQKNDKR